MLKFKSVTFRRMLILKIGIKWRDYFFTKPLGQMLLTRKTLSKMTFIQTAFIENNQNTQQNIIWPKNTR